MELIDCDPDEVPPPLRELAQLGSDHEIDLIALGAAMVEKFTGISVEAEALLSGTRRTFTAVPSDLRDVPPEGSLLRDYTPELWQAIMEASEQRQRDLAVWVAIAAAAEAGVDADPDVRTFISQLTTDPATAQVEPVASLEATWQREAKTWSAHNDGPTSGPSVGALEGSYLTARVWAGRALQYAAHPDPLAAALESTFDALWAYGCIRFERGLTFVEDEHGRRLADAVGFDLSERMRVFAEVALEAATQPQPNWAELTFRLPAPLSPQQREAFIERDQARQAAGDFDTWQRSH